MMGQIAASSKAAAPSNRQPDAVASTPDQMATTTGETALNIRSDLVPQLRALLYDADRLSAAAAGQKDAISAADTAAARLTAQLSDLDRELAATPDYHIPTEERRLSKIIAGSDVPLPAAEDIEAAALKARLAGARRDQVASDLDALRRHLAGLNAQGSALQRQRDDAEAAFLQALANATLDAYKRKAVEFVEACVPQLYSVADRLRSKTGSGPYWQEQVFGRLIIGWLEDETTQAGLHHPIYNVVTQLWPRDGNALVSGTPVVSADLVDDLIASIRDGG